jgi:Cys-tRNA synthase (O-phospho-L-seryl-tRNA:Cys-tRNA synthase)
LATENNSKRMLEAAVCLLVRCGGTGAPILTLINSMPVVSYVCLIFWQPLQ